MTEENKRQIVIPGEVLAEGDESLPGEGTEKKDGKITALRFGLLEERNNLVKVIPLAGVYQPRVKNIVIGTVSMLTGNGWVIDIGVSDNGFIPLSEVPRYVNKNALEEVLDIGDTVVGEIFSINKRGIDMTIKGRGLGRVDGGLIIEVNPNKVPRVIGKEGSMIKLIKDNANCNISVGQNGKILINGDKTEDELLARKAILFVVEKSFMSGLTDEVEKFFAEEKN